MVISTYHNRLKELIEHYSNPLHVYCRLRDLHIPERHARRLSILYENMVKQKIRHDAVVKDLETRLMSKKNPGEIYIHDEYVYGECDILRICPTRIIYYEIKTNHTPSGTKKAIQQLKRWTRMMYKYNKSFNYYGIYYSPEYGARIMCKNGDVRI